MDADKTLRRADFSLETDFKERLWQRLVEGRQSWEEGELADDFMEEVAAARAGLAQITRKKIWKIFELQ